MKVSVKEDTEGIKNSIQNVKFSCLMSVYKKDNPTFIKVAIDSILNQTLRPNQFLIIVDGPVSKEIKDLLISYQKKEKIIDLHFRDENLGLGLTLNEGVKLCKYNYIARMDADDFSMPERFAKEIDILLNNPNLAIVGSHIAEFEDDVLNVTTLRKVPETNDEIIKFAKRRSPFNHPSVIYKKDVVLKVGNYKNVRNMQDYFLWIDFLTNGYEGYNIQEPLVHMRADRNLFKRRSGKNYRIIQKQLLKYMKDKKFINSYEYVTSRIIRFCSAIAPNWARSFLYKKALRKKVTEESEENGNRK